MIALGIVSGVLSLAVLGMALRASGLKTDALKAENRRIAADKQLQETSREFAGYKTRTRQQLAALRADIASLEDDLEECATAGSRRARLERLLSKAADREDGGHSPRLPERSRPGSDDA